MDPFYNKKILFLLAIEILKLKILFLCLFDLSF